VVLWSEGRWELCRAPGAAGGPLCLPSSDEWKVLYYADPGPPIPRTLLPHELISQVPDDSEHPAPSVSATESRLPWTIFVLDLGQDTEFEQNGGVHLEEGTPAAGGIQGLCRRCWGPTAAQHVGCKATRARRLGAVEVLESWHEFAEALRLMPAHDLETPHDSFVFSQQGTEAPTSAGSRKRPSKRATLDLDTLVPGSPELCILANLLHPRVYWHSREQGARSGGGNERRKGDPWATWITQSADRKKYSLRLYWQRLSSFEIVVEAVLGVNILLASLSPILKLEIMRRRLTEAGLLVHTGVSPCGGQCYMRVTARSDTLFEYAERQRSEYRTHDRSVLGGAPEIFDRILHTRYLFRMGQPQLQRLLHRLISTPEDMGGAGVPTDAMPDFLIAFGPLHDVEVADDLGLGKWRHLWNGWSHLKRDLMHYIWKPSDIEAEAEYLGEKVALYFLWIQSYTRALYIPAIVGIGVGLYELLAGEGVAEGSAPQALFACVLIVWAQVWSTVWVWHEQDFAHHLGTDVEADQEFIRSDFRGRERTVDVSNLKFQLPLRAWPKRVPARKNEDADDGSDDDTREMKTELVEIVYPAWKRRLLIYLVSAPIVILLVGASSLILIIVTQWRFDRTSNNNQTTPSDETTPSDDDGNNDMYITFAASTITAVQMMVFSALFDYTAKYLNWVENYRTEVEFENAMIRKTFVYQFFNAYSALFIIALWPNAPPNERLEQLRVQMIVNVLVKPLFMNIVELGLPWFKSWFTRFRSGEDKRRTVADDHEEPIDHRDLGAEGRTRWMFLEPYHCQDKHADVDVWDQISAGEYQAFYDYLEVALQFGYMAMFAQVFPWGPACALFLNVLEIRVDAKKIMCIYRRAEAEVVQGIGAWKDVFTVLTLCSCVTNSYIVCYLTNILQDQFGMADTSEARLQTFLGAQYVLLAIIVFVRFGLSSVPQSLAKKIAREKYMSGQHHLRLSMRAMRQQLEYSTRPGLAAGGGQRGLVALETSPRRNAKAQPTKEEMEWFQRLFDPQSK